MRWARIKSVILHAWHHLTHSVETWVDIFWYPIIQALVFGSLAVFFARTAGHASINQVVLGILLWYGMEAGSYSIAIGTLWEIWAHSFSSLFVSPLTIEEFVAGHMIFGIFKQCLTVCCLSIIAFFAFHFSVLSLGWSLPIHFFLVMMFGWAVGMFVLGIILRLGTTIQSLAWGFIYIIQPIVGVFYPVSILPRFLQHIAYGLPPTYVFASARQAVSQGVPRWDYLGIALLLNIVYFVLCYVFMKRMWEWARSSGELARMEE